MKATYNGQVVELVEKGELYFMNGSPVSTYVDTYISIGGPKARLMVFDAEIGTYAPWNTWFAARSIESAKMDARSWAEAEDIPAII